MMEEIHQPDDIDDGTGIEELVEEVEGTDEEDDAAHGIEHDETEISEQDTQLIEELVPAAEDDYEDEDDSIMVQDVEIDEASETYEDTQLIGDHEEDQVEVLEEIEPEGGELQQSYNFKCDLCQGKFRDQFGFFEHLRTHYDGTRVTPTVHPSEPRPPASPPTDNDEEISHTAPNPNLQNLRQRLKLIKERRKSSAVVLPPSTDPGHFNCSEDGCDQAFTSQKALKLHIASAHKSNVAEESPRYGTRTTFKSEVSSPSKIPEHSEEGDHFMLEFKEEIDSEENSDEGEELPEQDDDGDEEVYELEEEPSPRVVKPKKGKIKQEDILCPDCGDFFETLSKLKIHKKLFHSDDLQNKKSLAVNKSGRRTRGASLQCKECSKVFNHKNSLVYHMKGHAGERNYECTDCGKKFLTSSALNVHNRLHTGEKPYKCEHCDKPFRQWGDLAYHMVSLHSNVRAFVCEFCGKDFARKYSLTVHRRIHTLERDYSCEFCSKSFRAASYLQSHRRIHTGEKPHNCDVCGKPFRVKSDMRRHRQSHNRSEKTRIRREGLPDETNPSVPLSRSKVTSRPLQYKLEHEPDIVVHNLVAVDESGQIIELEPQIAQQLRAGQVIQVPLAGSSGSNGATRRMTIENAVGTLINTDLESEELHVSQDEEAMKGEDEEQEVPVEYLQHADIVVTSDSTHDPSQGSLYVWPVFMS